MVILFVPFVRCFHRRLAVAITELTITEFHQPRMGRLCFFGLGVWWDGFLHPF